MRLHWSQRKESRRDDAQCATTHTTVCTSYVAAKALLLGCLARVAWKLSNWSGLTQCLLLVFPVFASRNIVLKKSWIWQRKVGVTMRNAPPHTTVCTSYVAAVVLWLPCQGGWKALNLVWFPSVFVACFPSSRKQEQCRKSYECDRGKWWCAMRHHTHHYRMY